MKRVVLFLFLVGCAPATTSSNGPFAPDQTILLDDATFDSAGQAVLNGWSLYLYGDTGFVAVLPQFVSSVPPGSLASASIELPKPPGLNTYYLLRKFYRIRSGVYKLTYWSNSMGLHKTFFCHGWDSYGRPNRFSTNEMVVDTLWKQHTLIDTLSAGCDSVMLLFTSASRTVLYNNFNFRKLH